jgi:L-fuconolactonase
MKIDAHHHFWHYDPIEYDWIDEPMQRIRRDFLPADLQSSIATAGVDGVVSVQARQTLAETDWLLALAGDNDFIKGVVGWVPLVDAAIRHQLERLVAYPKLCAVRHVVQGEPDDFLLGDDFNAGIALLKEYHLVYDILIFERQLPSTIAFVDRHPEQRFVLDHIAKPQIGKNLREPWRQRLVELALRKNVSCKISGMVTEADFQHWTPQQLLPYLETVLEAFGTERLMFGSDWPVCLVATEYDDWLGLVGDFASRLTPAERDRLFAQTAIEVYGLQV